MKLTHILTIGLFGLIVSMSGCASVTKQATNTYPQPAPDKGLVYFYREKKFSGVMVS